MGSHITNNNLTLHAVVYPLLIVFKYDTYGGEVWTIDLRNGEKK
jgi:hypothetical protein